MSAAFKVDLDPQKVVNRFKGRAVSVLQQGGVQIVRRVKELMSLPKSGNWYLSRGRQRGQLVGGRSTSPRYRASAPGEAPAVDLGELRNLVAADVRPGASSVELRVGIAKSTRVALRAGWLEFGTKRIAPRPAFWPATTAVWSKLGRSLVTGKLEPYSASAEYRAAITQARAARAASRKAKAGRRGGR